MLAKLFQRAVAGLVLTAAFVPTFLTHAQDLDQLMFTLGTTGRDSGGSSFGYVILQAQDTEAVIGRPYAVYEKAADFATSAPFSLRAVVQLQTNPQTIRSILNASSVIDDDFAMLESRINGYFEDVDISELGASGGEPDLAEKVSFAVRSAQAKPELFEGLYFLGRLHPGINVVLGLGYFGELSGPLHTWEIREWDPGSGLAEEVVGRVLLDASAADPVLGYSPLPAPGEPVSVDFAESKTAYENDPRGHLNVRLRWATPSTLREQSLLAMGYSVYRLPKQEALDLGWVAEGDPSCPPPTVQEAVMLLESGVLTQTNVYPIIPETDLSEAEANDASDRETFFVADDDDRFEPDAIDTFADGDEFYYFAGAQDLLRRPGQLSSGLYVKICDRQPPLPVDEVRVENHFVASTVPAEIDAYGGAQHLEVRWRQLVDDDGESVDDYKYYIYRWDSPQEMLEKSSNPLSNLVGGPIAQEPKSEWGSWIDEPSFENPDSPQMPDDASRTFFYTVRVEDASECGGNLSANSSPAYGVLRDRRPLENATGTISTRCLSLEIQPLGSEFYDREGTGPAAKPSFTIAVRRENPDIEWATLSINFGKDTQSDPIHFERNYYLPGEEFVLFDYQPTSTKQEIRFNVSGGDRFGNRSGTSVFSLNDVSGDGPVGVALSFELKHVSVLTDDRLCGPHVVVDRTVPGGKIVGPTITVTPPTGAKEYKLYRRINDGQLSLVAQGKVADIFADLAEFDYEDFAIPNAPVYTVCYFIQVFDEHGNASGMGQLDECIEFVREFPAPLLAEPELFLGAGNSPMSRLTWYCPPESVERFEVWIACNGDGVPGDLGDDLEYLEAMGTRRFEGDNQSYHIYQTRRLATVFGQGAPEFEIDVALDPNKVYNVYVRAVASSGSAERFTGPLSNSQTIAWTAGESVVGTDVSWPDRDLPGLLEEALSDHFNGPFGMEIISDNANGPIPALKVGEFTLVDEELDQPIIYDPDVQEIDGFFPFLMPDGDPAKQIWQRVVGRTGSDLGVTKSIFPFALYRYRMDAPLIREATFTIEQVTPLMREIAYESGAFYDPGKKGGDLISVSRVRDPYFKSRVVEGFNGTGPSHELFMLDHSPVQFGGTYQYLIVFFTDRGEIETVFPLNPITIQ